MTDEKANPPDEFRALINDWLRGGMTADQFDIAYSQLWSNWVEEGRFKDIDSFTCECLDKVFTALDAFCDDPDDRCEYEIDETQLRKEVFEIAKMFKPV